MADSACASCKRVTLLIQNLYAENFQLKTQLIGQDLECKALRGELASKTSELEEAMIVSERSQELYFLTKRHSEILEEEKAYANQKLAETLIQLDRMKGGMDELSASNSQLLEEVNLYRIDPRTSQAGRHSDCQRDVLESQNRDLHEEMGLRSLDWEREISRLSDALQDMQEELFQNQNYLQNLRERHAAQVSELNQQIESISAENYALREELHAVREESAARGEELSALDEQDTPEVASESLSSSCSDIYVDEQDEDNTGTETSHGNTPPAVEHESGSPTIKLELVDAAFHSSKHGNRKGSAVAATRQQAACQSAGATRAKPAGRVFLSDIMATYEGKKREAMVTLAGNAAQTLNPIELMCTAIPPTPLDEQAHVAYLEMKGNKKDRTKLPASNFRVEAFGGTTRAEFYEFASLYDLPKQKFGSREFDGWIVKWGEISMNMKRQETVEMWDILRNKGYAPPDWVMSWDQST